MNSPYAVQMMHLSKVVKGLSISTGVQKSLFGKAPLSTGCLDFPARSVYLKNM